jgi:signal transduction histidine kinase
MSLSLRARFALASGFLVTLVASAVAVAGYIALHGALEREARRAARGAAAQLAAVIDPGGGERGGNFVDLRDPSLVGQFARPGAWVVVAGPSGKPVQSSPGASRRLLRPALLEGCRRDGAAEARRSGPASVVSCRRVGRAVRPVGFVVAAQPLAGAQRTLHAARAALIAGVLGGGLGSFGLAWLLAARALRPIRRIAATARSIRGGDLSRRIGYAGPPDELGDLASELDASFAELEAALHRQERFVEDASHELKTPLAAARANVQMLRRWAAEDPTARAEALAALERSTARMARLVADLLQLARGDARLHYEREPVRLDELAFEAAREARALAEGVGVETERMDPALVMGDRDRLAQMLTNLLDNAVRVTPESGSVRLAVADDGRRVRVSISDSGPGVAAAEQGRLFERFYRGESEEPGAGSGLGLAIARVIAQAHDGEIELESEAGEGATFSVVLPSVRSSPDRHPGLTGGSSGRPSVPREPESRR